MSALAAATRIGARAAARVADRIYVRAHEDLPRGIFVERIDGGVVVTGRGLFRRMLDDARLRRIGR